MLLELRGWCPVLKKGTGKESIAKATGMTPTMQTPPLNIEVELQGQCGPPTEEFRVCLPSGPREGTQLQTEASLFDAACNFSSVHESILPLSITSSSCK